MDQPVVSSEDELLSALRAGDDRAVIAVDVGNNTYSFGRYFECAGQTVLMSGYLGSIGFAAYAKLCGGFGRKVTAADQLDDALREALDHDGPALVEIMSDPELI